MLKSKSKNMMLIELMTIGSLMKIVQSGMLSLSLNKKKCFNVKNLVTSAEFDRS